MKDHKIIFKRFGINSTTALDPYQVYSEDHGLDLDENINCCLYYDDDRLVTCNLYDVKTVSLPDWVDVKRYVRDSLRYEFLIRKLRRFKIDPDGLTATAAERLIEMSTGQCFGCLSLLKVKKFRSEFRRSLRTQLDAWLAADELEHETPFSHKQWACVVNVHIQNEARMYDRYGR